MDTRGTGNALPGKSISIAAAVRSASFAISHIFQSFNKLKKNKQEEKEIWSSMWISVHRIFIYA